MNTVESPDFRTEMGDRQKLLKQESPYPEYPPPYQENISSREPSNTNEYALSTTVIQPGAQTSQAIVIQPQHQMMGNYNVGRNRMNVFCQNCQAGIKTKTDTTHKCCTHCCCCLLALTGVLGPCCCLPYCFFSPDRVEHTCPHCQGHIGTYYG